MFLCNLIATNNSAMRLSLDYLLAKWKEEGISLGRRLLKQASGTIR